MDSLWRIRFQIGRKIPDSGKKKIRCFLRQFRLMQLNSHVSTELMDLIRN